MRGLQAFGCGQCKPCRIALRRLWSHRIMLEALLYKESTFVTLTYAEAPKDGVMLDHYTNFLKRFRDRVRPLQIRFYGVAEYGDEHGRPHYHFVLFGWPSNDQTQTLLEAVWPLGFVDIKPLTAVRAKYIAKYTVKKMTHMDDERLEGRNPEFSTKSLKPGLGHGMIPFIAATLTRYNLLSAEGDVPVTLAHGGKQWPLGRYLRRQLRGYLNGVSDELKKTPASHVLRRSRLQSLLSAPPNRVVTVAELQTQAQMLSLQQAALRDKKNPSLKAHLIAASQTEILNVEARYNNFTKRGQL